MDKDFLKDFLNRHIGEVRRKLASEGSFITDSTAESVIEDFLLDCGELRGLCARELGEIAGRLFLMTRRDMGILEPFVKDQSVSEIMVNGTDHIFVERHGHMEETGLCFSSMEEMEEVIRRIAGRVKREINELNPILDARLPDGSRVNAVYRNVVVGGPALSIRKFPEDSISMEDLIESDTLDRETADFLERLVICGFNIFVCGGTSSGKTTFLNVLSNFIPREERIIVIEDSAELQIKHIPNIVRMECHPANSQGKGEITMAMLIRTSLRMRPDRIIVGEVRGKEIIDMIQAMNTGHDGSLSTGHGNSISGMLKRMEAMYMEGADFPMEAIRSHISEAIDVFVHLGRQAGGKRQVMQIAELVSGDEDGFAINMLYERKGKGELLPTGNRLLDPKQKLALL